MTKKIPIIVFFLLAATACAPVSKRTAPDREETEQYQGVKIEDGVVDHETIYGPPEAYGPPTPETPPQATPVVAPPVAETSAVPVEEKRDSPKLCLVLGPGMAKAIAHAAVLEAIHKAGIPVHCVVGSEMGAVVGALYAFYNGNPNNLQWQLFKLNKDNYFHFPMISLRDPRSSGKKLNEFLHDIFHEKKLEDLAIRFGAVATDLESGAVQFLDKGSLSDALSASLAMPGIFEPWKFGASSLVSGAISSPAPIDLAKQLGGNYFVFVDVVEDSAGAPKTADRFQKSFVPVKSLVRLQKREANFVIQVKAGALPYDDFSRQGEYLAAGVKAAESSIPQVKADWEKFVATKR